MQTEISQKPAREALLQGFLTIQLATVRRSVKIGDFITIGRGLGTGLQLHDNYVSEIHCRIEKRKGEYWIRDMRSSNGTFVNGLKISEARLQPGDVISVGESEITFHSHDRGMGDYLLKSKNKEWQYVLDRLPLLARSDLPVLIGGPTGSGKEIMARTVHQLSSRADGPFVSVNCSALTESLVESELFGHRRGSFTGANEERRGAFQAAKGGTLFLDEIGDLPASVQPKLLRALENREVKPVGCDQTVPVNVRVVSATHKDLEELVRTQQFREDLFYRLNVLRVEVPSLQERKEDFYDFLEYFSHASRVRFSKEAARKLKGYAWPGQIRELKNFVARAAALYPGQTIEASFVDHLFDSRITYKKESEVPQLSYVKAKVAEFEIRLIKEKLKENSGNVRKTARDLGLPKSTLFDRLKHYKIDVRELMAEKYWANDAEKSLNSTKEISDRLPSC